MSAVLLDTHALLWLLGDRKRMGRAATRLAERAIAANALYVSAVSFWEIAMHVEDGKIRIKGTVDEWRAQVLGEGLREVPLDGVTAARAAGLLGPHKDPADRFIAATALSMNATLVTADAVLLAWKTSLKRQNAEL